MTDPALPPAGFYEDSAGRMRWWDGRAWTEHTAARPTGIDPERRRQILDDAVAVYVRHGYRIESNDGRQAVVAKRQPVRVMLNLLLVLVTAGFWLIILALRLLNWPIDRAVLTVDDEGRLQGEFSS